MFTGIIEELGVVKRITRKGNVSLLEVRVKSILEDTKVADSVAVNGVCLTIVKKEKDCLFFEIMQETLNLTNLGQLHTSDAVNLERALKVGDRLSGHFVSGHVDAKSPIRKKNFIKNNLCFEIVVPHGLNKYIVSKGSIAVDGISLTVSNVSTNTFSVYIIPHTLKNTTLKYKNVGSPVNIEVDILSKYILNHR